MDRVNKKLTGDLGIFLYKIFNDIFVLLLISYFLLLVSEGVMPGLVAAYLSFTKLTLVIFAVLGIMIYIGKLNNISFELENKPLTIFKKVRDKKTALICGLVIFSIVLAVNSLLKFTYWEIGIITISTATTIFYLYKSFK